MWSFIEHITTYMSRPKGGDLKAPTLWPSEASATLADGTKVGKCKRAAFFRYLIDSYKYHPEEYKIWKQFFETAEASIKPVDKYMRWIWKQGELYEKYLLEEAMKAGVYVSDQDPIYIRQLNVSGKKDIEVINPLTGKMSILEAKSIYGYYATTALLGKPKERAQGLLGKPKDSHLMQLAIYHWWHAQENPDYEESRLVYGCRDTGTFGEYLLKTEVDSETKTTKILYKPNTKWETWTDSGITINSITNSYSYVQDCLDNQVIPPRDFDLYYSEEKLAEMRSEEAFNKSDTTSIDAYFERKAENEELVAEGKKPKKALMLPKIGSWECQYCNYSKICYDDNGVPNSLT